MPRGTLKKRQDGRYRCKYNGTYFYGKTQAEANEARRQYVKRYESGLNNDTSRTVADYAMEWIAVDKAAVEKKTYNDYAKQLNVLIDIIGDMPIVKVRPNDIKRVFNHYIGYSDSTIHRARMVFNGMFDSAVENGYISKNPCKSKKAKPHKGTSGSHRCITDEERTIIQNFIHPFRKAVMVMLYAGLRRGEALALQASDIDIQGRIIHVSNAVMFDGNHPVITVPKTDAGVREVPIFDVLVPELTNVNGYIAKSKNKNKKSRVADLMSEASFNSAWKSYKNAIEASLNGHQKRWHHRTKEDKQANPELHRQMQELIDKGMEEEAEELRLADWKQFTVRPHDLRHSFCTMLRDSGVEMKLAMKWMGHADEKMILRVYDHITTKRTEDAIDKVEHVIKTRKQW